ncbi:MAG TPA: hypothetical protein PLL69_03845 [Gemmatimonadales bacterium]|nr:hypothetical protein [Gemmatimonadales bacterium]
MINRIAAMTVCGLVLAGCAKPADAPEPPPVPVFSVLPNIALPPNGQMVGTLGGEEAATLLVSSPMPADSVVDFYRDVLTRPPYRLINEAEAEGRTSFYVEQDGPSLWVTVEGLDAGGTLVRLSGAAVKPDPARTPPAGS